MIIGEHSDGMGYTRMFANEDTYEHSQKVYSQLERMPMYYELAVRGTSLKYPTVLQDL